MQAQRYKIYVNGVPVFLATPEWAEQSGITTGKTTYNIPYLGKKKTIKQYLDLLDKYRNIHAVVMHSPDLDNLWSDFVDCFKLLEAAGGFVRDPMGRLLVFYRRGSWDLPKGKIDAGETPEEAAVREVEEETGLSRLHLGRFIDHTYHTYMEKGDRILKKTWWFHIQSSDTSTTPQTEEDIEQIEWVNPREWLDSDPEVYGSIRDVIEKALE